MKSRKNIRLMGFDYSNSGFYFVTICSYNKECIFGQIINSEMNLNEYGEIVKNSLLESEKIRKEITLDFFIIMPNHIHLVLIIANETNIVLDSNPKTSNLKPKSLSSFVIGFKSSVTKQINLIREINNYPVWQRNYYEHIVRNEVELNKIIEYIINNPLKWGTENNIK